MRLHAAQARSELRHSAVETLLDEARVITEPLGGGPLARLAIAERAPEEWYQRRPNGPNEWRSWAQHVQQRSDGRWFERIAAAFVQREASHARLTRTVTSNGIVVTTGQQPGLFGGPIYTTAKALSALALADAIEALSGIPTAPVFWAATDDADVNEAAATLVVIDGAVQEVRMPRAASNDTTPLFALPLPDLSEALARLEEASGSSADARPISLVRHAYRNSAGRTVGSAFVELSADLFGPLGISVLDAGHSAVREAGHDLLCRALRQAPAVERAVATREQAIRAAGFTPQVEHLTGKSLVFEIGNSKVRVPVEHAAALARDARPGQLSPNVLLRPVVERSILPTAAYMAGPGELAYFAQVSAVAVALGEEQPLGVPRWSLSILEPHVARLAAELGIDLQHLAALHQLQARLAREVVPPALLQQLQALRQAIDGHVEQLEQEVMRSDSIQLKREAIEGARRALHFRVDRLERRVLAAAKHTDGARQRRLNAAAASLYPAGGRQERVANLVPFLARYGLPLLNAMQREASQYAVRLVSGQPLS